MLFTDSLQIAEVPQCERDYSTIVFGCLINKKIFEKDGCMLRMNWEKYFTIVSQNTPISYICFC